MHTSPFLFVCWTILTAQSSIQTLLSPSTIQNTTNESKLNETDLRGCFDFAYLLVPVLLCANGSVAQFETWYFLHLTWDLFTRMNVDCWSISMDLFNIEIFAFDFKLLWVFSLLCSILSHLSPTKRSKQTVQFRWKSNGIVPLSLFTSDSGVNDDDTARQSPVKYQHTKCWPLRQESFLFCCSNNPRDAKRIHFLQSSRNTISVILLFHSVSQK